MLYVKLSNYMIIFKDFALTILNGHVNKAYCNKINSTCGLTDSSYIKFLFIYSFANCNR